MELNPIEKLKEQYKKDIVQNDIIYDNIVHFKNLQNCGNIDKNINKLLTDETMADKEKRLI